MVTDVKQYEETLQTLKVCESPLVHSFLTFVKMLQTFYYGVISLVTCTVCTTCATIQEFCTLDTIHLLIYMVTTINRLSFIVFKSVQPYAHTYTVTLYSDVSVAATTLVREDTTTGQKHCC